MSAVPFIIYFIFSNLNLNKHLVNLLLLFGVVLSFQSIWAFTLIDVNYFDLSYKYFFVIPAGPSNYITVILLPLIILGMYKIKSKPIKVLYIILLMLSIILTKSRLGVLMVLLYIFYLAFSILYKILFKNHTFKIISLCLILVVVSTLIIYYKSYINIEAIKDFFIGFAINDDNINDLSSGRIDIYKNFFSQFLVYPIFGNGVSYEMMGNIKTHNFILTILYESGIAGILIYTCIGFFIYKKSKSNKRNLNYLIIITFIMLHSLFEDGLFTQVIDVIFWLIIVLMTSNRINTNEEGGQYVFI